MNNEELATHNSDLPHLTPTETIFEMPDKAFSELTYAEVFNVTLMLSRYELRDLARLRRDAPFRMYERLGWIGKIARELAKPPEHITLLREIGMVREGVYLHARHQLHLECSVCGHRLRSLVTWTAEDGLVYPDGISCCRKRMVVARETYIEKLPGSDSDDPEPERTWEWRRRTGLSLTGEAALEA